MFWYVAFSFAKVFSNFPYELSLDPLVESVCHWRVLGKGVTWYDLCFSKTMLAAKWKKYGWESINAEKPFKWLLKLSMWEMISTLSQRQWKWQKVFTCGSHSGSKIYRNCWSIYCLLCFGLNSWVVKSNFIEIGRQSLLFLWWRERMVRQIELFWEFRFLFEVSIQQYL